MPVVVVAIQVAHLWGVDGKQVLVGLTSWGSAQGCDRGKPTIFTRVSYYLKNISNGMVLVSKAAKEYNQAAPSNIVPVTSFHG